VSCFRPLKAYKTRWGEVRIGEAPSDAYSMELPCSRCIGCKMDRGRMWSTRLGHEAQMWSANWILTLTYDEAHLPASRSLEYEDFQGFMKRLRRRLEGVTEVDGRRPVRFFCAGEYGSRGMRPHYHAVLFNVDFPDKVRWKNGYFRSKVCEELWQQGSVVIGAVCGAGVAYVAGYCLKKQYGAAAREAYEDVVNVRTGELSSRRPEFARMSLKPAIGATWFRKYASDVLPGDFAVAEGRKFKVPRYYWEQFKKTADPGLVEEVAYGRFLRAQEQRSESTPERRAVREEVAKRRWKFWNEQSAL